MSQFRFRGRVPPSKSITNRLLVIESFSQGRLRLTRPEHRDDEADDVLRMRTALNEFSRGQTVLDCGQAGTTLRFLALRVSRQPGRYVLRGSARLLSRPQRELAELLSQLGVQADLRANSIEIQSLNGWQNPDRAVELDLSRSSQFASALLLSAWGLPFDLALRLRADKKVSESYFEMTLKLVEQWGLNVQRAGDRLLIQANARVKAGEAETEIDVSSAFALAALAAVAKDGECVIEAWPGDRSLQPDVIFAGILRDMGCDVVEGRELVVKSPPSGLRAVDLDLGNSPDLFPVLAILAACARGRSSLRGAPHLVFKESDRLNRVANLVRQMGAQVEEHPDGLTIEGPAELREQRIVLETDHDHRLAMAGAVARQAGFQIMIENPDVVKKSFPSFWFLAGGEA